MLKFYHIVILATLLSTTLLSNVTEEATTRLDDELNIFLCLWMSLIETVICTLYLLFKIDLQSLWVFVQFSLNWLWKVVVVVVVGCWTLRLRLESELDNVISVVLTLILLSPPYLDAEEIKDYKQKLSYLWLAQSGVGVVGTVLNSFVLWIFWKERQSLNTSINTMTRLFSNLMKYLLGLRPDYWNKGISGIVYYRK